MHHVWLCFKQGEDEWKEYERIYFEENSCAVGFENIEVSSFDIKKNVIFVIV